jgi:2-aminophenol/2-amino-5-chlorophenol 1,6-dioxygenase alpha subunit
MEQAGRDLKDAGVERIVYYSTQWISVLGHLYQATKNLTGYHVDENWYDLADLPFDFRVDTEFAGKLAAAATSDGYQTKLVDYEGFPVDSGTIVADTLLNPGKVPTNMVSCCVYSDYADTVKLAGGIRSVIDAGNKPTAVVVVSGLSGRWFTREIDFAEDGISDPADDKWNQRILGLFAKGEYQEVEKLIPDYAGACKVDMGLKGLAFLRGIGALDGRKAETHAYGGIYGTGGAVLSF